MTVYAGGIFSLADDETDAGPALGLATLQFIDFVFHLIFHRVSLGRRLS